MSEAEALRAEIARLRALCDDNDIAYEAREPSEHVIPADDIVKASLTLLQKRMTGMVPRVRLPSPDGAGMQPSVQINSIDIEVPGENGIRYVFTIDDPAPASG